MASIEEGIPVPFLSSLTNLGLSRLGINDHMVPAEHVVSNAVKEGVVGFLYHDTNKAGDRRSASIARLLAGPAMFNAAALEAQRHEFTRFVSKCVKAGIPIMLLKGVALAELVYKCNRRPMSDIDIGIRNSDLKELVVEMQAMGLVARSGHDAVPLEKEEHHIAWHGSGGIQPFFLECHWNIVPPHSPFLVKASELWKHALPCKFDAFSVQVLCPEHFLIHLCINWHYNGYPRRLRDLFDMYALATRSSHLRWDMLADVAQAWNADSVVYLALQEVMVLFEVEADFRSKAVSLVPRRLLKSIVVMPILRKMVGGKSRREMEPMVQSIVLAVSGWSLRTFVGWLLPSRARLVLRYGIGPKERPYRYLVRYYGDILRRIASIMSFRFEAKNK